MATSAQQRWNDGTVHKAHLLLEKKNEDTLFIHLSLTKEWKMGNLVVLFQYQCWY